MDSSTLSMCSCKRDIIKRSSLKGAFAFWPNELSDEIYFSYKEACVQQSSTQNCRLKITTKQIKQQTEHGLNQ